MYSESSIAERSHCIDTIHCCLQNLKTEELFMCECPSRYEGPTCKDGPNGPLNPCGADVCKEGEICLVDVDGVDVFKCIPCEKGE